MLWHRVDAAGCVHAESLSLTEEIGAMLASGETPAVDMPLLDLGMDSLMIVELRDRLQQELGGQTELSATLIFDYPRINDLAGFLVESLDVESAAGDNPAEAVASQIEPSSAARDNSAKLPDPAGANGGELVSQVETMSEQQALEELMREVDQ